MKWAVLSDIHSNKVALDAVLDDINTNRDVDKLICAGDIVGYGPRPKDCLDKVREVCDYIVQGNHDRVLATGNWEDFSENKMAYYGIIHAGDQVTDSDLMWLNSLPEQVDINDDFRVVHSHPEVTDRYVRPKDFARMRPYMDDLKCMGLGHTHIQHQAVIDNRLIFNPGSVGQPRDNNPDAAYAVIDSEDEYSVELCRVEYDIDSVVEEIKNLELPNRTAERLYKGK